MKKTKLICLVGCVCLLLCQKAHADLSAQTLADRLSGALKFEGSLGSFRFVKHGKIEINVES